MSKKILFSSLVIFTLIITIFCICPLINKLYYKHQISSLYTNLKNNNFDKLSELFNGSVDDKEIKSFVTFANENELMIESQIDKTYKFAEFYNGSYVEKKDKLGFYFESNERPFFLLKGNLVKGYSFVLKDVYLKIYISDPLKFEYLINGKKIDENLITTVKDSDKLILGPFIPGEYKVQITENKNIVYNQEIKLIYDYPFVLDNFDLEK